MAAEDHGTPTDSALRISNDHVRLELTQSSTGNWSMAVSGPARDAQPLFHGGPILAFTQAARTELPLFHPSAQPQSNALTLSGDTQECDYQVTFRLLPNAPAVRVEVAFHVTRPLRGWFHLGCESRADTMCWIYPWLNGGRDVTPTLGGTRLHMDLPGHIHVKLAGVPTIIARTPDGTIGGFGFPLAFNYHHANLAFDQNESSCTLAAGLGRNEGPSPFHGAAQYYPGQHYTFEVDMIVTTGGFKEVAHAWAAANDFAFDQTSYYSLNQAIGMATVGRGAVEHAGTRRYISSDVRGIPVRGYRHSSHQNRISIYRQPLNAYVDHLLFERTGTDLFRQRAVEQMDFLLASQTEDGWYYEDWQIGDEDYSYEVIGQDGGVTQVLHGSSRMLERPNDSLIWGRDIPAEKRTTDPTTGRNITGPRPDYLGITTLYTHKLIQRRAYSAAKNRRWQESLDRCIDWILRSQRADGSFPMTVSPDGSVSSDTAPCSRLLLSLDRIGADTGDERLDQARAGHEQWVIDNCVATGQWWGSHKDTGLTIDYGGLQTFIQYCLQRYDRTSDGDYLSVASECTYFNFFEHCPKQLEWLWHHSKGGIQEQSNYLQPDIDTMDNLVLSSWYRLAVLLEDDFLMSFAKQQLQTTMLTLCDDPSDPWFGTWAQYLVDYADAVGRHDQNPVTENKTKYSGSITPSILEDLFLLISGGYPVE